MVVLLGLRTMPPTRAGGLVNGKQLICYPCPHSFLAVDEDPVFQQSMMEGGGAQRAVVDLLVEQVRREILDIMLLYNIRSIR